MPSFRCWILIYTSILLTLPSDGQVQQVKIMPFSGTNGISLGKINSIARDKFGFIWFSDQSNRCIIRYDGTHMTRYQNEPNNPNSLGGYYPECLFADSAGNIWIGFYGMGLDKYDPLTNTFTHYQHKKDDPASLANDFVSAVLVDHLGKIWVGTDGGLDLLDEKTGTFKHHSNIPGDTTSLSSNTVRAIYEDKSGEIWVGSGFPFESNSDGGLNRFHRSSGIFTRYLHDPSDPGSIANNKVRSIIEDSYGNFWIGTGGDGLHTLDRSTGRFTHYYYNSAKPNQLSRPPVKWNMDHITFITEDADKKIWIGTLLNGLTRYDPISKEIQRYGSGNGLSGSYKDNTSWAALSTAEGLIWFSTQSAELFRIDIFNTIIPFVSLEKYGGVTGFTETDTSHLWLGVPGGLVNVEQSTGKIINYIKEPGNSNSLREVDKDKKGNLWIGTRDGLYQYVTGTRSFRHFPLEKGSESQSNRVNTIMEDNLSNIWAGTSGNGLFMLNPESGKLVHFKNDPANSNTIGNNAITSILEDQSGDLWIGTFNNGGLDRLNRKTGNFSHYLPGLTISSLFKDSKGMIWAASESGLFHYNSSVDGFDLNASENVGASIAQISAIAEDSEDNLWISAENGIYKINSKRSQASRYGRENGIPEANNFFYYGSGYKSYHRQLYFGNSAGYYVFDPLKLKNIPGSTRLYFTHFWLNNKEIRMDPEILKESILTAKEIRLKHDQNLFSISAAIVDLRNSGGNILYLLENFETEWRSASAEERISYYNVAPGRYILRIKAADIKSGDWVEKSIAVIIAPPWWNTWWAYILYGLAVIAVLYMADRIQRKRIIEKERRHSREKELEQAKEIEQAYHKLKATQSQLIQSEKMASLGELTAGIAHEIQNPLNFVNNFSEVNKELLFEMKEEMDKGNLVSAKNIANDVIENQEKINHHGKRADAIVKGMLQHSKSGIGVKEPTDINAIADEYLRLAYQGLKARDKSFHAKMETDFDKQIGHVNIVSHDIGRVFLNLINNAFYAVNEKKNVAPPDYEPTVWLKTKRVDDKAEISIRDNGNGIPEKIKEKIFQPFFTTKPTGQGTGLGLSLSYDIIKVHQGNIIILNTPGEGVEFIITLPINA